MYPDLCNFLDTLDADCPIPRTMRGNGDDSSHMIP